MAKLSNIEMLEKGGNVNTDLVEVESKHGSIFVTVDGDREKKPMLTFHDVGLTSAMTFDPFFNAPDKRRGPDATPECEMTSLSGARRGAEGHW
eukprot:gene24320-10358_t